MWILCCKCVVSPHRTPLIMPNKKKPSTRRGLVPRGPAAKAIVHMRCFTDDKETWIAAARDRDQKLTPWIIETLNRASAIPKTGIDTPDTRS